MSIRYPNGKPLAFHIYVYPGVSDNIFWDVKIRSDTLAVVPQFGIAKLAQKNKISVGFAVLISTQGGAP